MNRTLRPGDVWPRQPGQPGAWWRSHARVLRDSVAYATGNVVATLMVWLLIGIAILLPAGLYLLTQSLAEAASDWQGRPGLSVYLEPGVDPAQALAVVETLRQQEALAEVRLIAPEEALAELAESAELDDVLALLDHNPLPATVRATAASGVDAERLAAVAQQAERAEGVDAVVVETSWLERLAAIRNALERLVWLLSALLGTGAVLVASASVRLAIESRLAELQVLAIVGATRRYMRRPFFYLGLLYGGGGGLVAAMCLSGALLWLEQPMVRLFASYGAALGELRLASFDIAFALWLLAAGGLVGCLGAMLATGQRIRSLGAEEID